MFGNDRWIVDVAVLPNPINLDKCGPQEARHSLYKVELKQTSDGAYYYLDKFKRQTIAKTGIHLHFMSLKKLLRCVFPSESSPEQMESTLKELAKQNNTKSEMANVKFGSWQHKIRFQANPDQLLNFQVRALVLRYMVCCLTLYMFLNSPPPEYVGLSPKKSRQ